MEQASAAVVPLTLIFGDGWQADAPSRIDSPSPLLAQVYGTLSCVPIQETIPLFTLY